MQQFSASLWFLFPCRGAAAAWSSLASPAASPAASQAESGLTSKLKELEAEGVRTSLQGQHLGGGHDLHTHTPAHTSQPGRGRQKTLGAEHRPDVQRQSWRDQGAVAPNPEEAGRQAGRQAGSTPGHQASAGRCRLPEG
jgi:hypothetical protein